MLILAAALPLVGALDQGALFLLPAALMGLAQALIFPAAKALVSEPHQSRSIWARAWA